MCTFLIFHPTNKESLLMSIHVSLLNYLLYFLMNQNLFLVIKLKSIRYDLFLELSPKVEMYTMLIHSDKYPVISYY